MIGRQRTLIEQYLDDGQLLIQEYFAAAAPLPVDNANNEEIENNVFELDDNFLENLMRCQVLQIQKVMPNSVACFAQL